MLPLDLRPGPLHVPANRIDRQSCGLPCSQGTSLQERAICLLQEEVHKMIGRRAEKLGEQNGQGQGRVSNGLGALSKGAILDWR